MRKPSLVLAAAAAAAAVATVGSPAGADGVATYEVTVTNLTTGQWLTPPAAATHDRGFSLWRLGKLGHGGHEGDRRERQPGRRGGGVRGEPVGVRLEGDSVTVGSAADRPRRIGDLRDHGATRCPVLACVDADLHQRRVHRGGLAPVAARSPAGRP
jgi:hypothetical protein